MKRNLNLTNRQSLLGCYEAYLFMVSDRVGTRMHWDVQVELIEPAIAELNLNQEWECWVEVYTSLRVERFRLGDGRIGNKFKDRFETNFDSEAYPLLRIKIVAVDDPLHQILASKVEIRPTTIDSRGRKEHLLPLRYEDIGQIPWYVREPAGNRPRLIVNSNLHRPNETVEVLVKDKLFTTLVLPAALRQILHARIFTDVIDKDDLWLKFVHRHLVLLDDLDDDTSTADREVIIDTAVEKFCEINSMITVDGDEEVSE